MSEEIKKVSMYSFKGGSGRTVSTGNIAYVLAKEMGKDVVTIDLDTDSAGSTVLFGKKIRKEVDNGDIWTIQDVLRGKVHAGDTNKTINLNIKNFKENIWKNISKKIYSRDGGSLTVVPARMVISEKQVKSPEKAQDPFETLLLKMELELKEESPDVVLFDSASGLQDMATLGIDNCTHLTVYMRWSKQFVQGTKNFIDNYLKLTHVPDRDGRGGLRKIFLTPTVIPREEPVGKGLKKLNRRRRDLNAWVRTVNEEVKKEGGPIEWVEIVDPIRECNSLKWDDKIFLKEGTENLTKAEKEVLNDYRNLAKTILES